MGIRRRPKPRKLAKKLAFIRKHLGVSQGELVKLLRLKKPYDRSTISAYERGEREPPLPILLKYARLVHISTDHLIDDAVDLSLKRFEE